MAASVGTVWVDVRFNIGDVGRQLQAQLSGAVAGTGAAAQGAAALERTFSQSLTAIGKTAMTTGRQLSVGLTLPLALIGKSAVSSFAEFDTAMTKITALNKVPIKQTEEWRGEIRALGKEYGVAAEEVADAMYFITSSGQSGAEAMETLRVATKASAVGFGETKVIADVLTSAMSAYKGTAITAAKAGDILAAAVRTGKGEADELAGSLSQVIPLAANAGVSFGEMAGAMSAMTLSGTSSDQAATQLRGLFNTIQDMPPIAERALLKYTELDAKTLRLNLSSQGLIPTLQTIFERFGDNKVAMAEVFGNIRALTGIMNLFGNNTEQTLKIIQEVTSASGELNDAWEITAQSKSKKLDIAMNNIHDAMLDIGESVIPMVTGVATAVGSLVSVFGALPGPVRNATVAFAGLGAVAGPALIAFGSIARGAGALGTAITTLAPGLTRMADGLRLQVMYANEASKAGTGLIASLGGLGRVVGGVGIAAAGAAAGWAIWNHQMEEAQEHADALQASLAGGSESGGMAGAEASIGRANEQIRIMKEEIGGAETGAKRLLQGLSILAGPLAAVLALKDADYTEAEKKLVGGLEAGNKITQDRIDLAGKLAAVTGKNKDVLTDWLAAEARAGRFYGSTKEAQDALTKSFIQGDEAAKKVATSTTAAADALGSLSGRAKETADQFFALTDAEDKVADARRAVTDATKKVADAQQSYADAHKKTLDADRAIIASQRRVTEATNATRDARLKLVDAQKALNDALAGPSEDEQLDVQSARLAVQEAQKRMRGKFDDPLDRQRAQIDLRRAQLELERTQGAHDERVVDLRTQVAAAEKSVSDAVQAEVDAAQGVIDARDAKADAVRNEASAYDAIGLAQLGVTAAEKDLLTATSELATQQDALGQAIGMSALNGSAFLSFLEQLKAMEPSLTGTIDNYAAKFSAMWAAAGGDKETPATPEPPKPPEPAPEPVQPYTATPKPSGEGYYIPGVGYRKRAAGGPLSAGQLSLVNEKGMPELWSAAGKQYLLPVNNGQVTPLKPLDVSPKGGDGVSIGDIYVQGAPDPVATAYEVRRQMRVKTRTKARD